MADLMPQSEPDLVFDLLRGFRHPLDVLLVQLDSLRKGGQLEGGLPPGSGDPDEDPQELAAGEAKFPGQALGWKVADCDLHVSEVAFETFGHLLQGLLHELVELIAFHGREAPS